MSINPLQSGSGQNASQASSNQLPAQPVTEQDFLTLLAAELKYQDPTKPVSGTAFVAQLAQFATLSGVTGMQSSLNSLVSDFAGGSPLLMGAPLLGKTVTVQGSSGGATSQGTVTGLSVQSGQLALDVSGVGTVPLSQVVSVSGA